MNIERWIPGIKRTVALLIVPTFVVAGVASSASAQVSCGDTITADVTLTADLDCTGFTGTVLTVGADGITIDGQGHSIIAPDASVLLSIVGRTGVTVRDIVLSGGTTGILVSVSGNNTFTGVDVSGSGPTPSGTGISLSNSTGPTLIDGCTVTNRVHGIYSSSDGTTIQGNNLSGNERAVYGDNGRGHVIVDNDLSNATEWAIFMRGDDLLQVTNDNVLYGSVNGIWLYSIDGLTLSGLDLSPVPGIGLRLTDVTNSTFSGVVARGTTGISESVSGNNTFTGVDVSWPGPTPSGTGIWTSNSTGTLIDGCTITNRVNGIYSGSDGTTIQGNDLSANEIAVRGVGGQGHVIVNNDLSNATGWPITMHGDDLLQVTSDNVFHGCANGIALNSIDGLTLSGLDLSPVPGIALWLTGVTNSTFSGLVARGTTGISESVSSNNTFTGLDVSWPGPTQSGTGISTSNSTGTLIDSCTITNRVNGIYSGSDGTTIQGNDLSANEIAVRGVGGQGHVIVNNDLSNATGWPITMHGDDLLQVTSDNVFHGCANGIALNSIDGLTLSGLDLSPVPGIALWLTGVTNSTFSGLVARGTTGISESVSSNNTFTGVDVSWPGPTQSGTGISTSNSTGTLIDGCTITNRVNGIYSGSDGTTIQGNDLSANEIAVRGVGGQGHVIVNNDLSNATGWPITMHGDDLLQVTSDNVFHGCANGIALNSIDGLTLSGLDLSPVPGIALWLTGVTNSTFSGLVARGTTGISESVSSNNTFTGVDVSWPGPTQSGTGISTSNSTGTLIDGCTITNRVNGIYSGSDGTTIECSSIIDNTIGVHGTSGTVGVSVNMNHIEGNFTAGVQNAAAAALDAQFNFWGAPDGPSPLGSGDAIVGNVLIDPFFASLGELYDACDGIMNLPPTAVAGADQSIHAGDMVYLDGIGSFDDDTITENLLFAWSLIEIPAGSLASLVGAGTRTPDFLADLPGTYKVHLVVTDEGGLSSVPDEVVISSTNLAPTADAGSDTGGVVGLATDLDGSASVDPEGDPLSFWWTITQAPLGSLAMLANPESDMPSLVPDLPGLYVIELVVNDTFVDSTPDEVEVTVITGDECAENYLLAAIDLINSLPSNSVTTKGNQNALTNFLSQAIAKIQAGDLAGAINKIDESINRTDGYIVNGQPDGNGPGRDWITDPAAQTLIYAELIAARACISP